VVRLWSRSGELLDTLPKRPGTILSLAYSADGENIAAAGTGNSISLYELARARVHSIDSGHGLVNRILFLHQWLVSAGHDRFLRVWELSSGALARAIEAHNDSVYTLGVSANGQLLVSGGRDGTLRLWDTSSWVRQGIFRGHTHSVLAVVVHPNGKTIASGGADGTIKFWDATRSEMTASVESGHISVNFVAFSPGGDWLVSGGTDQIVRFWELGEARTSRPGE